MSEVKRYGHISYLVEATPQILSLYPAMTVYVLSSDYDAAQSELAALREELKTSGRIRAILVRQKDRALGIIKELRDGKNRDARIMGAMALDIVAVGEALSIPGEEQEGGTGEFVEAILDLQQRLTAAEQRNSDLVALLECVTDTGELTRAEHDELEADICAAVKAFWDKRHTTQPTESGASE